MSTFSKYCAHSLLIVKNIVKHRLHVWIWSHARLVCCGHGDPHGFSSQMAAAAPAGLASTRAELLCVAKSEVICLTQFPANNDLEFNFAEPHSVIAAKHS